ncbi:hypothetical protein [Micromonospora inyonensis]|uniref:Uncharacterized protein n=1 Tax=Micromonospora inyonensis TaxID=47866 RepID=A0A1C6RXI6_9ACTN|nr:hypothetical protein [Micromonospora inyonensis]SCL21520.1 hypothetical protein GA0074694_3059 [Micromonospora inyonensis]SCL21741.1 hypothetical protein GA0074694_3131 [Micromonospora inyonensis]
MTLQQRIPLVRDLTTLAAGVAGFAYALKTGADWPALLVSAALMAGPGVVHLLLAGHTPGAALSSAPASPAPPSPSPLPSSAPSAGDPR